MKTTIVFSHPWHGSYNKAILDSVTNTLESNDIKYNLIDLYKDDFDPRMKEADLALFSKGESTDPLVKKYQNLLKETDNLIIVSPIWWYSFPAILKGFIDKVMLKTFAYIQTGTGLKGLLSHIDKTVLITTSEAPKFYLRLFAGNPLTGTLNKISLKSVGLKKIKWLNKGMVNGSNESRVKFINKVSETIDKL